MDGITPAPPPTPKRAEAPPPAPPASPAAETARVAAAMRDTGLKRAGDALSAAHAAEDPENAEQAVVRANTMMEAAQVSVRFRVAQGGHGVQIDMYDPEDGTLIRVLPFMGLRDMMRRIQDLVGGLVIDRRA